MARKTRTRPTVQISDADAQRVLAEQQKLIHEHESQKLLVGAAAAKYAGARRRLKEIEHELIDTVARLGRELPLFDGDADA